MKKMLLLLFVVLISSILLSCEPQENPYKPQDVSEYIEITREGMRIEILIDKDIDGFFQEEFGENFEYTYDYKYLGDHTYSFTFKEKNKYRVIAYATVHIPKLPEVET